MKLILPYIQKNPLSVLFIAFPVSILAFISHWGDIWVFSLSTISVIPMAGYIGKATEMLAAKTGPKIGGLLNATLGNAAELIITLVAIQAGLLDLVKASITGSIIGNLLLVLGFSILLGGLKNGTQKFDRRQAGNHTILMVLAVVALVIPSFFSHFIGSETSIKVEVLSLGVAVVMIVLYCLGLLFTLKAPRSAITYEVEEQPGHSKWSTQKSLVVLALATIGVVVASELLVGAVEHVVQNLGMSEFFMGIILIPVIGNVAEHLVAVQVARRNQMELSLEIAASSSIQIALFVAPVLVFISLLMGHPLTLIFNQFELIALGAAVIIATMVASDGESNWLEGAALLGVYLILCLSFFLLPT